MEIFFISKGRAKGKVLTSPLSPGGRAYRRALKIEKSLSPSFVVGREPWLQMSGAERLLNSSSSCFYINILNRLP